MSKLFYKLGLEELVDSQAEAETPEAEAELQQSQNDLDTHLKNIEGLHTEVETLESARAALEQALNGKGDPDTAVRFTRIIVLGTDKRWGTESLRPSLESDTQTIVTSMEEVSDRLKKIGKAMSEMFKRLWEKVKSFVAKIKTFFTSLSARFRRIRTSPTPVAPAAPAGATHQQTKENPPPEPLVSGAFLNHLRNATGGFSITLEQFDQQMRAVVKLNRLSDAMCSALIKSEGILTGLNKDVFDQLDTDREDAGIREHQMKALAIRPSHNGNTSADYDYLNIDSNTSVVMTSDFIDEVVLPGVLTPVIIVSRAANKGPVSLKLLPRTINGKHGDVNESATVKPIERRSVIHEVARLGELYSNKVTEAATKLDSLLNRLENTHPDPKHQTLLRDMHTKAAAFQMTLLSYQRGYFQAVATYLEHSLKHAK